MLVGAVMGFWAVQRAAHGSGLALAAAVVVAAIAGALMAVDPRLPRDHAAREPDRLGSRADDLRGRGRAFELPRQRPQPRRPAGRRTSSAPVFPASMQRWPIVGPIVFGQNMLVYASWLLVRRRSSSTSPARGFGLNVRAVGESPAAADAMGINVQRYRYAHTIAGGALAGARRRDVHARDHAAVGRRDHGRRRLDCDRARHLRVLAPRALPRRRLLLRRAPGARSRAASAPHQPRTDRALDERAPVRGDDRRPRHRLGEQRPARLGAPAALGVPYAREER